MKNSALFILSMYMITMVSCGHKDKDTDPKEDDPEVTVSGYSQLKVGNYWIYQEYTIDSALTTETPTTVFDSCYIKNTFTIRGNTYYQISISNGITSFSYRSLRDSADCIVDQNGYVEFSLHNFSTPLYTYYQVLNPGDTASKIVVQMKDKGAATIVPAGTYTTINSQMHVHMYPPYQMAGIDRNSNRKFSENVGIVSQTKLFSTGNSNYTELRLVRYHLN